MAQQKGNTNLTTTGVVTDGGEMWIKSSGVLTVEKKIIATCTAARKLVKDSVIGSAFDSANTSLKLSDVSMSYNEGNLAVITFKWTQESTTGGDTPGGNTPLSETWQTDWQDLEKPILSSSLFEVFGSNAYDAGTSAAVTGFEIVERLKAADAVHQKAFKFLDPGKEDKPEDESSWIQLGNSSDQDIAVRKYFTSFYWKGIESYLVMTPILRHVKTYSSKPDISALISGKIKNTSGYADEPTGYKWRFFYSLEYNATAETWTLSETYQGADSWNSDLYGEAQ